jgi:hypothetical protein
LAESFGGFRRIVSQADEKREGLKGREHSSRRTVDSQVFGFPQRKESLLFLHGPSQERTRQERGSETLSLRLPDLPSFLPSSAAHRIQEKIAPQGKEIGLKKFLLFLEILRFGFQKGPQGAYPHETSGSLPKMPYPLSEMQLSPRFSPTEKNHRILIFSCRRKMVKFPGKPGFSQGTGKAGHFSGGFFEKWPGRSSEPPEKLPGNVRT